jgi:hypothetical protein
MKRSEEGKESPLIPSKYVGTFAELLIQMLLCNLHDKCRNAPQLHPSYDQKTNPLLEIRL